MDDYELVVLSNANVKDWFPEFNELWTYATLDLAPTQRSDYLRMYLLIKYGGVWADATLFCKKPLDNWIEPALDQAGMYIPLMWTEDGRAISTFFIASKSHNEVMVHWFRKFHENIFRPRSQIIKNRMGLTTANKMRYQELELMGPMKSDFGLVEKMEEELVILISCYTTLSTKSVANTHC